MLVYLKQSGELLTDDPTELWTPEATEKSAERIKELQDNAGAIGMTGLTVVSGGGNIVRGNTLKKDFKDGFQNKACDALGRLGTFQNTVMLWAALKDLGVDSRIFVAPNMAYEDPIVPTEPYSLNALLAAHANGEPGLILGGDGRDNSTTDGAVANYADIAARAFRLEEHRVLKATTYDGVFEEDPRQNPDARRYSVISAGTMLADPERYAAVDPNCMATMASAPENLTMQVYAYEDHTPLEVLSNRAAIGTLIIPSMAESVFA